MARAKPEWLTGIYDREKAETEPLVIDQLDMRPEKNEWVPTNSLRNVVTVFDLDTRWRLAVRWDECKRIITVHGEDVSDEIETEMALWLSEVYSIVVPTTRVHEAVGTVAHRHPSHPIREWLNSLTWDGEPRCDMFPVWCLGAVDTQLTRELFRRWMISAVARVMQPGCKVDTCLILVGKQGAKKSTALAELTGRQWFSDTPVPMGSKDAYEQLAGVWVYELAELDSVRRAEASAVKAFISAPVDKYRPSYGRNSVSFPRQCVFVGSTNEEEFLSDPTGSRRFWPLAVGMIDLDRVKAERDQLWAEAVTWWRQGEPWWLEHASEAELSEASDRYRHSDSWDEVLSEFLVGKVQVTVAEILEEGLKIKVGDMKRADEMRVAQFLVRIGWERSRIRRKGARISLWTKPETAVAE